MPPSPVTSTSSGLAGRGALGRARAAARSVAWRPTHGEAQRLREPVGQPVRRGGARRAARRRRGGRAAGQQPLVQRPHRLAGRRAELVAQQHAQPLVGGQRLRDLAARRQRLHQQPVAGLAQRRRRDQLARPPARRRRRAPPPSASPACASDLERAQAQLRRARARRSSTHGASWPGRKPAAGDRDRGRGRLPRRRRSRRPRSPRAPARRPRAPARRRSRRRRAAPASARGGPSARRGRRAWRTFDSSALSASSGSAGGRVRPQRRRSARRGGPAARG